MFDGDPALALALRRLDGRGDRRHMEGYHVPSAMVQRFSLMLRGGAVRRLRNCPRVTLSRADAAFAQSQRMSRGVASHLLIYGESDATQTGRVLGDFQKTSI